MRKPGGAVCVRADDLGNLLMPMAFVWAAGEFFAEKFSAA
jgi:hypothetical protein